MNAFAQFLTTGINPYEHFEVRDNHRSGSRFSPEELATLVTHEVLEGTAELPAFLDLTDEEIKNLDDEAAHIANRNLDTPAELPAFLDLTDEEIKNLDDEAAFIATR